MLTPKKSLGQHFLHDPNIIRNIVSLIAPAEDDLIVEIGPGPGALTKELARRGARIIAVEIDPRAVAELERWVRDERISGVDIVHDDILRMDLTALSVSSGRRVRLAGNLPYYLTSQILFHAFAHAEAIEDCTFMMQREVARRLASPAGTKEYGILAVFAQLHADVRIAFHVSPNVFIPKPAVWSSVIRLTMAHDTSAAIADMDVFRAIVRGTFGKRRKTLANSLAYLGIDAAALPGSVAPILSKRPEQLSVADFITLANAVTGGRTATADAAD